MNDARSIHPPRPRTHQTEWQHEIELMVACADVATAGLRVAIAELVPANVRDALLDLASRLTVYAGSPRFLRPHPDAEGSVGVTLFKTRRPDGRPYTMVLTTHEPIVRPEGERTTLLNDGFGPEPGDHLDGWRFSTAFAGLLRILEREVRRLRDGDDWNWNDGSDPTASPGDDENWHPEAMLARVRAIRREAERAIAVEEVHAR